MSEPISPWGPRPASTREPRMNLEQLESAEVPVGLKVRPVQHKAAGRLRPKNQLFYVDPKKKNIAYLWDTKYLGKAKDLVPYKTMRMVCTCAYYGFFKPTWEEILKQIPPEDRQVVRGIELPGGDVIITEGGSGHEFGVVFYRERK